jgi:hypothetical protein
MRIGKFELSIEDSQGRVLPGDENGYVVLRHGEHYSLVLGNHSGGRAALYAKLDERDISGGEAQGKIMIRPGVTKLERIPGDHGRFTFYTAGSDEAAAAGEAALTKDDKGIVQVKFVPERRQVMPQDYVPGDLDDLVDMGGFRSPGMGSGPATLGGDIYGGAAKGTVRSLPGEGTRGNESYGAGMTGLSGHSSQQFHTASPIDEDPERAVTVTLRLVHDKTATDGPHPLPGRAGNSVPPPVE